MESSSRMDSSPKMKSSLRMDASSLGVESSGESYCELDGSYLEGGGQILRNSVAYSALLQRRLRITKVREARSPRGLRMQHLKGIDLVRELCDGEMEGAHVKSSSLAFAPRALRPSGADTLVDIQTAGSITLLIQAVLPVLLFQPPPPAEEPSSPFTRPSTLTLIGGTNATFAPQIDYFVHVFLPIAERMFGAGRIGVEIVKRGYYPKGGGRLRLLVTPLAPGEALRPLNLTERGEVTRIHGYVFAGGVLPLSMAWEMHKRAVKDLRKAASEIGGADWIPSLKDDLRAVKEAKAGGGGSGLVLWAETARGCVLAGDALGERTKALESVATEATSMLLKNLSTGACVDEFLQDQLIVFMALAEGPAAMQSGPLSLHAQTAMWIASELLGVAFDVRPSRDRRTCLIQCDGIGFRVNQDGTRAPARQALDRVDHQESGVL